MAADGEIPHVWQIAAGDGPDRDYARIFLRYGLAAVGPGDPGPYDENEHAYEVGGSAHRPFLAPFRHELDEGDLLVLKRPAGRQWEILAVGVVEGPYHYEPRLGDVEGWDLQHCRRVRWRRPPAVQRVTGLVRGTLKRVRSETLQQLAADLWAKGADLERDELPEPAREVDDEHVIGLLIDHGVSSSTAESTAQTLRRLRRLADWYARVGEDLGEHEIRTFVVVPLLLALGWPEQRMRIEYRHADIALFDRPFSQSGVHVQRIVETKRVYHSLGDAPVQQAAAYADADAWCHSIVVTDGFRWKLFERFVDEDEGEVSPWTPTAYADIRRMRDRHPFDVGIGGADRLLLNLLPE